MFTTTLISSAHWKTLVPFCLRRKRTENALLTLTVNYRKIVQKKKLCHSKEQKNLTEKLVFQKTIAGVYYILNIHIFSLVHQLRLLLTLPCLICLVSAICMFNSEEFIYGRFEDCIGLFNSRFRSFLCQYLH